MEDIKDVARQLREAYNKPIEIKKFGRKYYAYFSTTVWDKEKKKRRKISRYIGRITREGLVEADKSRYTVGSVFEYGNARLAYEMIKPIEKKLEKEFGDIYVDIVAMGIIKLLRNAGIKMVASVWEKIYLSQEIEAYLSPGTVSKRLRMIGRNMVGQMNFYHSLIEEGRYLIFDLSYLHSYSRQLPLAEKGYNKDHLDILQVNFIMGFSIEKAVPVMMKVVPGSVREIKSFQEIIRYFIDRQVVLVLDRGYGSKELFGLMRRYKINFIISLQRGFRMIDFGTKMEGSFTYRDRGIKWGRKATEGGFVYLYEDVVMRAEQETGFIIDVEKGKKTKQQYEEEKEKFGKFALYSNLDMDGKQIYLYYKQRENVEVAFDALKNQLENDKLYLSDQEAVRGYFFIIFIALYLYFRIHRILKENDLHEKFSVKELLFELSKVYLVYYKDGKKRLTEIPKKVEVLTEKLKLNLFPKDLRS
jgi:transposase/uncharacterized protein (DUF2267 family)